MAWQAQPRSLVQKFLQEYSDGSFSERCLRRVSCTSVQQDRLRRVSAESRRRAASKMFCSTLASHKSVLASYGLMIFEAGYSISACCACGFVGSIIFFRAAKLLLSSSIARFMSRRIHGGLRMCGCFVKRLRMIPMPGAHPGHLDLLQQLLLFCQVISFLLIKFCKGLSEI